MQHPHWFELNAFLDEFDLHGPLRTNIDVAVDVSEYIFAVLEDGSTSVTCAQRRTVRTHTNFWIGIAFFIQ